MRKPLTEVLTRIKSANFGQKAIIIFDNETREKLSSDYIKKNLDKYIVVETRSNELLMREEIFVEEIKDERK